MYKCSRCKSEISLYDERCSQCDTQNKHFERKTGAQLTPMDWHCLACATLNSLPSYICRSK